MKNSIQIDYVRNISAIIAVTCQKIHYVQLQVAFFFRIWKQSSTQGSNQVPHKSVTQFANTIRNNEPEIFVWGTIWGSGKVFIFLHFPSQLLNHLD